MLFDYTLLAAVLMVAVFFITKELFTKHKMFLTGLANGFASIACGMFFYQSVIGEVPMHTWQYWSVLTFVGTIYTAIKCYQKIFLNQY